MDVSTLARWWAEPTRVEPVVAGAILEAVFDASPRSCCTAARRNPSTRSEHFTSCPACRTWLALGRPVQLAGADAAERLCQRARSLAALATVGSPSWRVAQTHVATCRVCREALLADLAWPSCGAVRECLADNYWAYETFGRPAARRQSQLAGYYNLDFGGPSLLEHLRRCLPCRHWCATAAACPQVIGALERAAHSTDPYGSADIMELDCCDDTWDLPNPVDVAHLQLCQGCQQHLTAYLDLPGLTMLYELATDFAVAGSLVSLAEYEPRFVVWRRAQLERAGRHALAWRAVIADWLQTA